MSRLDQALRQAKIDRAAAEADRSGAFISPWKPDVAELPSEPADAPANDDDASRPVRPLTITEQSTAISFGSSWRERRATAPEADPNFVEQYRRLAAVLQHAQASSGIRTIMITSAGAGDGKTLTALNLSLVLSESHGARVLLIDADLRRPSLGHMLELANVPGLGDALRSPTHQPLSVIKISPTFTLLPGGRPDPDPIGRLTSERMRLIMQEAKERFDWVILDAPPAGPIADAQFIAQMADAAVFVIRAEQTRHTQVTKAIEMIGRDRILGVILNGVTDMPDQSYQYIATPEAEPRKK